MRLLLTHGFFLAEDAKEQQVMRPYPPLGLLYLSAYLRAKGFDVEIYDSTFGSKKELYSILDRGPRGWLGIYGNLLTRQNVVEISKRGHASGWRVVLGGPEPANYAEEYLNSGAEYVVRSEGELTLANLLAGDPAPSGVIYRDISGSVVQTEPEALIPNLDSLPWPDRERINLNLYLTAWRNRHGKGSVSLITARGCPYHCRWCSHSTLGKTHRRRSVSAVADEPAIVWQTASPNGRYAMGMDLTGEAPRLCVVSLVSRQKVLELTPPIAVPAKAKAVGDVAGSFVVAWSWDENEGLVGVTSSDHPSYFWLDLVNGKVIDRTTVFTRALGKGQATLVDAHFISKDALYLTLKSAASGMSWDLFFRITGPNEVRYERREPTPDARAPLGESILLARKIERLYQALRGTLNETDRLVLTAEQQSWLAEREVLTEPEERLPFERDRYTELNNRLTARLAELGEKAD